MNSTTHSPIASSSTAAHMEEEGPRQASPLPVKRGEIGFVEAIHGAAMAQMDRERAAARPAEAMGERHPADRPPESAGTSAASAPAPGALAAAAPQQPQANASTISLGSLSRLKRARKPLPKIGGVMLWTWVKFVLELLLLGGTGVGWAFAIMALQNTPDPATQTSGSNNTNGLGGQNTNIFVHVAFAIVALAELVFLERQIFRIRAERYAHKHPGEMLPRGRGRYLDSSMPMAPWQRPSLPTYAAALAQSGGRTGDVEDALIAQPPPPAYGKTRGSTLLLQGFLTTEHQRRARHYDEEAQLGPDGEPIEPGTPRSVGSMVIVDRPSRPASYRSHDENWEAFMDAQRARVVEEALAAMEGVPPAHLSDRDRP